MEESTAPAELDILTFWVGPFLLGVDAGQIVRLIRLSHLKHATIGRGTVNGLPIQNLRRACGLGNGAEDAQRQYLVVRRHGEPVACLVDRIGELISVEIARYITPLPPLIVAQTQWQQLWGVCRWGEELVLLVDLGY
jgi:chemotaxis signal transduction protein